MFGSPIWGLCKPSGPTTCSLATKTVAWSPSVVKVLLILLNESIEINKKPRAISSVVLIEAIVLSDDIWLLRVKPMIMGTTYIFFPRFFNSQGKSKRFFIFTHFSLNTFSLELRHNRHFFYFVIGNQIGFPDFDKVASLKFKFLKQFPLHNLVRIYI